ncbi:MAG: A/G-specific adenine glycosylase [Acidobacteria bacterium]|nr:A/G-specific adenine glycosylase [Acidobacteriota bacterium]
MFDISSGALTPERVQQFRRKLMQWYRVHARDLPWRNIDSPYHTWVSEIMLQQTRVNAVVDYYRRFMEQFPTVIALALAKEEDVLAAWSGLGYYRRARMLHHAAKFLVAEHEGVLPNNAEALRKLPGIGEYTCAAIASIGFGERIAVVDGNVERVLLRVTGRPEDNTSTGRAFVRSQAQALVPARHPGDHNQAMMELGAMVCTPREPHCKECPVFDLCITRGEHMTNPRPRMRSQTVAYGVWLRNKENATHVLLRKRPVTETLMGGMVELPLIEPEKVLGTEPVLRLRHAITRTNYYVEVYKPNFRAPSGKDLIWVRTTSLDRVAFTGLAKKILVRLDIMRSSLRDRAKGTTDELEAGS